MRFPWALVVFAAMALSGCAGAVQESAPASTPDGASPTPVPSATTTYRENGTLAQMGKGSLEGLVHDDFGFIIEGAHVVLAGTIVFADTDERGRFAFANLSAKVYALRVDHKEFLTYEADVEVKAGQVAELDITLVRAQAPDGNPPHKHDWWGDDKEVVIMDRDLEMGPSCAAIVLQVNPSGTTCEWRIVFRSSDNPNERPNVVYQGTGKMTLHITVGALVLPFEVHVKKPGTLLTKATTVRGPSTTWETPVLENETDPSHYRRSSWEFYIQMSRDTGGQGTMAYLGPVHWKVTITRSEREIPVEPPHPDRWGQATERVLLEKKGCRYDRTPASTTTYSGCGVQSPPDGSTVTVGTGRMKATLAWTNTLGIPARFAFEYVGADQVSDSATTEWVRAAPTKDGPNGREFDFNVRPELWDSPYSEKSLWRFRWILVSEPPTSVEFFQGTIDMKVEIYRDAA